MPEPAERSSGAAVATGDDPATVTHVAPTDSTPELNYFSEREQRMQAAFRGWRDQMLAPLVRGCRSLGITAGMISGAALAMLVPVALGLLVVESQPLSAALVIGGLLLHVGLDGLDGPLARATGNSDAAGAFTDMCLDHVGLLTVVTLLTAAGRIDGAAACAYVSTYTVAVVLVVALNMLHRPLQYVLRTKYIYYLLTGLQSAGGPNWLTIAAIAFSVLHGVSSAVGFVAVRRALRGRPPASR